MSAKKIAKKLQYKKPYHKLKKALKKAEILDVDSTAVLNGSMRGAYQDKPLNLIEFTLHEAAHVLTLGQSLNALDKLEPTPVNWITCALANIPPLSSNALEMDTAFITFLAGVELNLWDNSEPIQSSARSNLRLQTADTHIQLESLFKSEPGRTRERLVKELVSWCRKP